MRNYYIPGDWNALCDRCAEKHKASQLKLEWTGLRVCKLCVEVRHPQTLIRVPKEDANAPWSRPEPAVDTFITVNEPLFTEANDWLYTEANIILNSES